MEQYSTVTTPEIRMNRKKQQGITREVKIDDILNNIQLFNIDFP